MLKNLNRINNYFFFIEFKIKYFNNISFLYIFNTIENKIFHYILNRISK